MHQYSQRREHGLLGKEVAYKSTFLPQHASALALEHTLSAHGGCVNRIHWDETGSRLVSGSDDRRLLIWEYPDVRRLPVALTTRHRANIFGAHIMPQTNGYKVVSCSMDRTVQLHELPPDALNVPYGTGAHLSDEATTVAGGISQPRTVQPRTTNYTCHSSRVKDVEVEPMNPHNFWSASEDGTVRQFDSRCRTDEQSLPDSRNLLVHARDSRGNTVELKSLDICQAHPHLLAVACSDPFVRIYDRRKLSMSSPESLPSYWKGTQPLLQLAPAHLAIGKRTSAAHSTYVCFSQKGDRLVTSYHGDHAYAFDVTSAGCTSAVFPVPRSVAPHVAGEGKGWKAVSLLPPSPCLQQGSGSSSSATGEDKPLPVSAAWERDAAEQAAKDDHFLTAMEHYDHALHLAPWSAALWSQRAEALLKRGWAGDAMWALRDCDVCLAIDPRFWQARLQRGRALKAMGQIKAALGAVQDAAAAQAHAPGGHIQDREAERQIAELREQLKTRLREMEEERERDKKRLKRIRDRRKETMQGSAIRRRGASASPGAGGTSAAGRESGSDQQVPVTQPQQQQQQQQQEGSRGESGGRERAEGGGQRLSAIGGELVGREEAADASGEESERHREDSDSEGDSEKEQEEEEEVFAEYYGFEDQGPSVGPQLFSRARAQRHPSGSHSVGSSMESRRQGRSLEEMVQDAMPGGPRILQRYMGHINVQTDIKEATYLGGGDALVACGSDDGKVYVYDAITGMPLRVLQADQDVVNCVQSHPHLPVLATSGIEDVIRLWTPGDTGLSGVAHRLKLEEQVLHNQERVSDVPQAFPTAALSSLMECHPQLMSLLLGAPTRRREGDATDSDEDEEGGPANVRCRVN